MLQVLRYICYACILLLPLDIQVPRGWQIINDPLVLEVVLDASLSMSTHDLWESRFVIAKDMIAQIISQVPELRLGVLLFSWVPVPTILFSQDIPAILQRLTTLSLDEFPLNAEFLGTAVGDALLVALSDLDAYENSAILLISDGSSSRWVDPLQVAYMASDAGIPVHTLAIGSEEDIVLGYDREGEEVYAQYDIATLEKIALLSNWNFVQVTEAKQVEKITQALIEQMTLSQQKHFVATTYELNHVLRKILVVCVLCASMYKVSMLYSLLKSR